MTKRTKLLVGVAFVASLFSTPAFAAGECDLTYIRDVTGQDFGLAGPTEASQVAATLWNLANYAPERAVCSQKQAENAFYQLNGKGRIKPGDPIKMPRLARLAPAPAPTTAPAPAPTPAPAPVPNDASRPAREVGEQIADLYHRIDAGGNPAAIEALKAQIAALEARPATAVQTVVEHQPIHTTKTVQVGLSAAELKRFSDLEAAAAKGVTFDASQLAELERLRERNGVTERNQSRLFETVRQLVTNANNNGLPWWGWALIAFSILLGFFNLLRKAGKTEVRQDRTDVGQFAQRQFQVEFEPSNFEELLRDAKTDEVVPVKMSGVDGDAVAFCKKLRWGKVQVGGNESRQIDISRLRYFLSQRYNQGGFGA